MHNSIIYSSSALCKTEADESLGNKALDILKEKMKIFELDKIPQYNQYQNKKIIYKQRSKTQKYQIHSKVKQPSSYSQYRISNKKQTINSQNRFSKQILESVKSRQSVNEPKLIDMPVVRVSRERILNNKKKSQNNISLILMEKYYQATIKYEEKKQRKTPIMQQPKYPSTIISNNQAVKTLQRKIRYSRRELLKELNTSLNDRSITPEDPNLQEKNRIYFAPIKTIDIKRNYSTFQ